MKDLKLFYVKRKNDKIVWNKLMKETILVNSLNIMEKIKPGPSNK